MPKHLSAASIYKQMEKLETLKRGEEENLAARKSSETYSDIPAQPPAFETYLNILRTFTDDPLIQSNRAKIIERLIHKIEITPDGFQLFFHVGQTHILGELAAAGSPFSCPKPRQRTQGGLKLLAPLKTSENYFDYFGSNTLIYGWGTRIRT